jgi:hypothetical protein
MKRISIFLLSLVFIFIPLNPALAEQDYLDKRWAKTGCKPLNKQTKNSLIVTDVVLAPDETGVVRNIQKLYFQRNNLQEYSFIKTTITTGKNKKETKPRIKSLKLINDDNGNFNLHKPSLPQDLSTVFPYNIDYGWKGACSQKGNKGMIFTVYLLKEYKDKKPYKWLQFQSTGKGRDDSL